MSRLRVPTIGCRWVLFITLIRNIYEFASAHPTNLLFSSLHTASCNTRGILRRRSISLNKTVFVSNQSSNTLEKRLPLLLGLRNQHSLTRSRTVGYTKLSMMNAAMSSSRRLGKVLPGSTVFFACDIQERFRDLIHNMPAVISTGR